MRIVFTKQVATKGGKLVSYCTQSVVEAKSDKWQTPKKSLLEMSDVEIKKYFLS